MINEQIAPVGTDVIVKFKGSDQRMQGTVHVWRAINNFILHVPAGCMGSMSFNVEIDVNDIDKAWVEPRPGVNARWSAESVNVIREIGDLLGWKTTDSPIVAILENAKRLIKEYGEIRLYRSSLGWPEVSLDTPDWVKKHLEIELLSRAAVEECIAKLNHLLEAKRGPTDH